MRLNESFLSNAYFSIFFDIYNLVNQIANLFAIGFAAVNYGNSNL